MAGPETTEREARLAKALRANLRRRKARVAEEDAAREADAAPPDRGVREEPRGPGSSE